MMADFTLAGVVGAAAAIISTLFPQVVKTGRTRSAKDLLTMWLVIALFGMGPWIAYGVPPAWAVVGGSVPPFCIALLLLALKLAWSPQFRA
jgi:hypothetical protein